MEKNANNGSGRQHDKAFTVRFAKWILKWRWLVIIGSVGLFFGTVAGMQHFGMNNDYHIFFGEDNPQLLAYDGLQDKYIKSENVFVVIEPKSGEVFNKETFNAISDLVDRSWRLPASTRVDAITNYQRTRSVEDDLYVEDFGADIENKTADQWQEMKEFAVREPLLINRLINESASVTGVNITVQLMDTVMMPEKIVADSVRAMVDAWKADNPGYETYLSGVVMLNNAFGEAFSNDMATLIPLMFLIIVLIIWFTTWAITGVWWNVFGPFATLLVVFGSMLGAMGIAFWLGIKISPVSGQVPVMVLTLAVADSIHILITMYQQMRKGRTKREAIIESLRMNFMPVVITSLTTAIGFLTMNFSDSPPFHDLGNIAAMGMVLALFYSVTLLPAVMSLFPVAVKSGEAKPSKLALFVEKLGDWIIARNKQLLIGASMFALLFTGLAMTNVLDTRFVEFFAKSIPFRQHTDFLTDNLTGIYTTEFSLGTGEENGISKPEYLAKLDEFEQWFEGQEGVIHVSSFSEVTKRVNRSMHGDDDAYYKIPDSREEAAQYLLLYEMSLPYGLGLNNQINVDKSETRFVVTLENMSASQMRALTERGQDWLTENAPEEMYSEGMSVAMMFAHLTDRQIKGMLNGNFWGIILISIVLIFALRSWKYGLMSLIPNILPITAGFGIWALIDGEINVGLTTVFGMVLGIVVDDSVHFLSKYLRARREGGLNTTQAVRYAFTSVGTALVVTTIVLVVGFSTLLGSAFLMNSNMGLMTAMVIALALVLDFFMLPGILLIGKGKEDQTVVELEDHGYWDPKEQPKELKEEPAVLDN